MGCIRVARHLRWRRLPALVGAQCAHERGALAVPSWVMDQFEDAPRLDANAAIAAARSAIAAARSTIAGDSENEAR